MIPFKLEVHIPQLIDKIGTKHLVCAAGIQSLRRLRFYMFEVRIGFRPGLKTTIFDFTRPVRFLHYS